MKTSRPTLASIVVVTLLLTGLCASNAAARDWYVTPGGAGEKTGERWDSAIDKFALRALLLETVQPGDRVMLGSGDYGGRVDQVSYLPTLGRGGTAQEPIELIGVDTGGGLPRLVGKWKPTNIKYHAHSWSGLSIARGVGHVRIANFRIVGCMHGITTEGDHVGLAIQNVAVDTCREAILLQGVRDSSVTGCRLTHYTKKGINFEKNNSGITVTDVVADATGGDPLGDLSGGSWLTEEFPFGFTISPDGNRDIHYLRCVARNNLHAGKPNSYWNGDGFVAEAGAEGITYTDCLAHDNNDGGWDDKSTAAVLTNCIAVRNKRNIRIWNVGGSADQPTRLINCIGAYAVKRGARSDFVGLWTRGAVVAERCTFHANPHHAVSVSEGGHVTAVRCLLTGAIAEAGDNRRLVKTENGAEYVERDTVRWPGEASAAAPDYVAASPDWTGEPADALESRTYRDAAGYVAPKH